MNAPTDSHRGNSFDLVRLAAAWSVLVSHHYALSGRPEPQVFGVSLGGLGVMVFFALSGYLVTRSLHKDPHVGRFLVRRGLRIIPGLAVNVMLCALVLGLALTTLPAREYLTHPQTIAYVVMNLLYSPRFGLPGVLTGARFDGAVNGSLWTLPFEVICYLVLAAFGLWAAGRLRWIAPAMLVASLAMVALWQPASPVIAWANDLRHLPRFMAVFFAGSTLAFHGEAWLRPQRLVVLLCAYVVFDAQPLRDLLASWVVPCLTLYFGLMKPAEAIRPRNDISYGVYLYAFPMQQTVLAAAPSLGFLPTMALAAVLTGALAAVSWFIVERPALAMKPRRVPTPAAVG